MIIRIKKILSTILVSLLLVSNVSPLALAVEDTSAVPEPTPVQTTIETPAPEPSPQPVATQETATPPTGPTSPSGADSSKYTLNPETGNWESDKYTWNPTTQQSSPKNDPGYYYNPENGRWETTEYVYHPESGRYEPVTTAAPAPASAAPVGTSGDYVMPKELARLLGLPDPSNSNTGPNSTNTATTNSSNGGFFDLFSRAVVNNNINSTATSGNALVSGNTTGGSATSGPATVVANLVNLLSSFWSWANGNFGYFAQDMFGDYNGDINIDPLSAPSGSGGSFGTASGHLAANSNTGPDSTNTATSQTDNDLTINSRSEGEINNNLNLFAQSGDAEVSDNTRGGNATTGDATVELNILNLINSQIISGQSWLGLINIFGNLNGDILFPAGFLDNLINGGSGGGINGPGANVSNSDTGPNSTNDARSATDNNVNLNLTNDFDLNNSINTAAESGNAGVTQNTRGGNATTGDAETSNSLFNLANMNVIGENAVLVLVNVMGRWIGAIMDMPNGGSSTSGLLGGNASVVSNENTGPNSSNTASDTTNNDLTVNHSTSGTINNNINAGAISGNANVSQNTEGGNATSGNARVASNIANIFGSNLGLSRSFGILVINVFGDWFGSVNKDTEAGEAVFTPLAAGGGSLASVQAPSSFTQTSTTAGVPGSTGRGISSLLGPASSSDNTFSNKTAVVASKFGSKGPVTESEKVKAAKKEINTFLITAAALLLLAGGLSGLERRLSRRKKAL